MEAPPPPKNFSTVMKNQIIFPLSYILKLFKKSDVFVNSKFSIGKHFQHICTLELFIFHSNFAQGVTINRLNCLIIGKAQGTYTFLGLFFCLGYNNLLIYYYTFSVCLSFFSGLSQYCSLPGRSSNQEASSGQSRTINFP